jgi:hypothetical protein
MRELFTVQFWLRPGVITAVFALLMLGAAWFVIRRPGPAVALTAVELLEKSINAEDLAAANTSTSIHRVFQIEQRRGGLDGEVMARQRVDVWQSAVKGVTVRRLYDDRGRLLAGEWIRADGVSTLYHQGSQPQIQIRNPEAVIRNPNDLWRLSPSAKDFNALFGASKNARLEAQANHYVVTFDGEPQKRIRSSLVLNRDDLHAIEQTWLIQQGNQTVAYRMVETSFERRPNDAVAPAVFEPEPELTSDTGIRGHGDTERIPASASLPLSASSVLATPALEVEVLHLLNQTNAFMGEQISVTRTSQGRLLVSGLVETEQRKNDLLHSLASVRGNPALHIQIETVAEAAQRARPKSSGNVSVERFETTEGTSPAYVDLKKKFSEDEARRFTDRVINRSRQARRHALALKQLAERFSLTDLRALPEADRLRWLSLLKQHARNFETEVHGLRRELQTVFSALTESGGAANGLSSDSEIQEAVRRLYELSVMVDEDVRQSFALSSQNPAGAEVKTQQFWQSLKSAEVLAARIAQAR